MQRVVQEESGQWLYSVVRPEPLPVPVWASPAPLSSVDSGPLPLSVVWVAAQAGLTRPEVPRSPDLLNSLQEWGSASVPAAFVMFSVFVCLTLWDFAVVCRVPATACESRDFGAQ